MITFESRYRKLKLTLIILIKLLAISFLLPIAWGLLKSHFVNIAVLFTVTALASLCLVTIELLKREHLFGNLLSFLIGYVVIDALGFPIFSTTPESVFTILVDLLTAAIIVFSFVMLGFMIYKSNKEKKQPKNLNAQIATPDFRNDKIFWLYLSTGFFFISFFLWLWASQNISIHAPTPSKSTVAQTNVQALNS